jgi:hypothetical protein
MTPADLICSALGAAIGVLWFIVLRLLRQLFRETKRRSV